MIWYSALYALAEFCTIVGAIVTCLGYSILKYSHGNATSIYDFESPSDYYRHAQWRLAARLIILCGWCLQGVALSAVSTATVAASTTLAVAINWAFSTSKCRCCFLREDFRHMPLNYCCNIPSHGVFAMAMFVGTILIIFGNTQSALHRGDFVVEPGLNIVTILQNMSTEVVTNATGDVDVAPNGPPTKIITSASIDDWQLLLMATWTCCFSFLSLLCIDSHDERAEHYEKTFRMNQCEPEEADILAGFFTEMDAVAKSSHGAGGCFWRYRSEILSISGGCWSNLMYAFTKCVFMMLSSATPLHLGPFYIYLSAAIGSAYVVIWILQKAMSGPQGNAVVLLLLNACQSLFGCYSTVLVFHEVSSEDTLVFVFWTIGTACILLGIFSAFFVMDAPRSYLPVNRKETEIAMQELCRNFDMAVAEDTVPVKPKPKRDQYIDAACSVQCTESDSLATYANSATTSVSEHADTCDDNGDKTVLNSTQIEDASECAIVSGNVATAEFSCDRVVVEEADVEVQTDHVSPSSHDLTEDGTDQGETTDALKLAPKSDFVASAAKSKAKKSKRDAKRQNPVVDSPL